MGPGNHLTVIPVTEELSEMTYALVLSIVLVSSEKPAARTSRPRVSKGFCDFSITPLTGGGVKFSCVVVSMGGDAWQH